MHPIGRNPALQYAELVQALLGAPGVTHEPGTKGRRSFGADALKVGGKIFAMLVGGHLVVKLPASRVSQLVHSGDGARLDTGGGRIMKEWLSLSPSSQLPWLPLAREALEFVSPGSEPRT